MADMVTRGSNRDERCTECAAGYHCQRSTCSCYARGHYDDVKTFSDVAIPDLAADLFNSLRNTVPIAAQFNAAFDAAIAEDVARSGYQVQDWFRSGLTRPEVAIETWRTLGPRACQNYIDWYETSGYHVWHTPDGRPAVELKLEVTFGAIPVVMYVDAVLENCLHLLVQDTKSGAKVPDSQQQLGLYACGIELAYGIRPAVGSYFMARGAGSKKDIFLTEPISLDAPEYSVAFYTEQFAAMETNARTGSFVARVGKHCKMCDVSKMCAAVGGGQSRLFDPSHPGYKAA